MGILDQRAFAKCVDETVETGAQRQREAYNLAAQQQVAEGGIRLIGIGVFELLLTLWGILVLRDQLVANQTATEAMLEANRISEESAKKTLAETRRIGEAQTKAYLGITACNATFSAGKLSLQPTFNNSGQSPALEVRWTAKVSLFVVGTETLRMGYSNKEYLKNSLDIPAQQQRQALYYDCGDFGLEAPEIAAFAANEQVALSVSIEAFGKDVFGERIEGRDDFIHIFRSAPVNLHAYTMTLGSRLNPQPEQESGAK